MSIFVLASSSIPDVSGLRRLHRLPAELHDSEVAEFAFQRLRAGRAGEQLPAALQKLVAFAVLRLDETGFVVSSRVSDDETALLGALIEASADARRIVRWNEREASLAALRQRCVLAGQIMPLRHALLDVGCIDELGGWLAAGTDAPELGMIAKLAGLPLERGFETERIWHVWLSGDRSGLCADAERRALAVLLLHLRRQHLEGALGEQAYHSARATVWRFLDETAAPAHLLDFRPA